MKKIKESHYVVDFTYIDDFRCFHPLKNALYDMAGVPTRSQMELLNKEPENEEQKENQEQAVEKLRSELCALFFDAGWEGDGEINCIVVPPCFICEGDGNRSDGHNTIIYHVKQRNNGISWLAIPKNMKLRLAKKTNN